MYDSLLTSDNASQKHSTLSASASSRWLNCTKSIKFSAKYPDEESEFAKEGTLAHELCAYKLNEVIGTKQDPIDMSLYDKDMDDYSDQYVEFVKQFIEEKSLVFVEKRVDYSDYIGVENSFGTADCIVINDETAHIIDFKYGRGVKVDAFQNTQMMMYALGALSELGFMYDIKRFVLHIFQPRLSNISIDEIKADDLVELAQNTFAPRAQEAIRGKGEFKCGEWCRFCRGKEHCFARARAILNQVATNFEDTEDLSDEDVVSLLNCADDVIAYFKDIKEMALNAALGGKQWKGYELKTARAVRKFTDEKAVAEILESRGIEPYEITKKLKGVTAVEKALGKKEFSSVFSELIEKSEGKPQLVKTKD